MELEHLGTIDWARLRHAGGPADDVPGDLRALTSADPAARDRANRSLCGTIFHQGTRYSATAPAVPFLLTLAADPLTPDRHEIVLLLAALAVGYDELPGGYPIAEHRAYLRDNPDAGPNSYGWSRHDELAAYDAVRAGVGMLTGLLDEEDAELRKAAAYVLAWFPEHAADLVPALTTMAGTEPDDELAATALVAIGLLTGPHAPAPRELIDAALDGDRPPLRWAAATVLARIDGESARPEVAAELGRHLPEGEPGWNVHFCFDDIAAYSEMSFESLGLEIPYGE